MAYSGRMVPVSVALAMLIAGCAAPRSGGGGSPAGPPASAAADPCDTAKSAVAGAVAGALLGALSGGKNVARGAVAGGLIGALACVAINSSSRQTKTAAVVEQDYTRAQGRLPAQPQLVSYQTRVDPNGTIRHNTNVTVRTNVEIVRGTSEPVREVKEEIVLYDTDNKEFKRGTKTLTQGSGGSYETDWQFRLPAGVTQGQYKVETLMYVNGRVAAQRETRMQLVMLETHETLAVVDTRN